MDSPVLKKKAKLNFESTNPISNSKSVLSHIFLHPCIEEKDLDIENNKGFNPDFAHHFFIENEQIPILENHETYIHIFYSCNWFDIYVDIQVIPIENKKYEITNVDENIEKYREKLLNILKNVPFEGNFCSYEEFIYRLKNIPFDTPPGDISTNLPCRDGIIEVMRIDLANINKLNWPIYNNNNIKHPIVKNFSILHRRMEWFLHWYIESASSIDQEDRWIVWLPYFKHNSSYLATGLMTTYSFFAIPKIRLRISQFLILPQFQGQGIGLQILKHIYNIALQDDNIMEITIEDPAPSMIQLRDILNIQLILDNKLISNKFLQPLDTQKLLEILETTEKTNKCLKQITLSCFNNITWNDLKVKIHSCTKESPRQIERILLFLAFARFMKDPLPPLNVNSTIISIHITQKENINEMDTDEVDTQIQQKINRLFRIAVKHKLLADNAEYLLNLSQAEMLQNLDNLWNKLYSSFYISIKKIRSLS
ncbi:hypothetical protein cand_005410 [Cryptosporidium andersoni]|uniref:histone acetyltransferase n=1 Tax=Cryptosporidium andersoni TaxID=117008 RepID=A0A1J4MJN4_9CRYT|nr:hypothetical protein cand_005410 [Cryptosporidium andersoni]